MRHSIKASVTFCFKGEVFSPSLVIDLDGFFVECRSVDSCYVELGHAIGLDHYRHEYDVMESEPICFTEPVGLAVDYVQEGMVDWFGLKQAWRAQAHVGAINLIANKYFNVENIEAHPKLAAALMDAYQTGSASTSKKSDFNSGLNEGFYG